MLDQLLLVNPGFAAITELSQLGEENFELRDYQRPAGYSATTRVHAGRMCVPMLCDSGGTCSCMTDEQVILLVNHTQRMLTDGKITTEDYNYPLVQFYRYKTPAHLKGIEKDAKMI